MVKYRVILADSKAEASEEKRSLNSDGLIYGLIGDKRSGVTVRLARSISKINSDWEIRLGKFTAVGLAAVGLAGGVLTGEAEASTLQREALPQAKAADTHFVPWNGWQQTDPSREAVRSLDATKAPAEGSQLLSGPGGEGADSNGGLHSNGDFNHSNTPTTHSNEDWNNHTNASTGHTNGPWSNHVNTPGDGSEFQHMNIVPGDFIF
ncbi:hypothetical protein IJT17_00500 [bacterium]|nr:hypothetical protein [bacterium]